MTTSDKESRSTLFVSYRRDDSPHATGRIYDRLVVEFGEGAVFRDVDSIPIAANFRVHIEKTIKTCDALLAVIGPRWIDAKDSAGQLRLRNPHDLVRVEIETALEIGVPVVPLFVDNVSLTEKDLPESLQELTYCHGLPIRRDPDFRADVGRLVERLKQFFAASRSRKQHVAQSGSIKYPNGNEYVGPVKDGRPHGQGTMIYAAGAKYVGEWKDGKKHGWGVLSGKGDKYAGEWNDGRKVGLQCVTYADGTKYAGEWRDRSFHGLGILIWSDGGKYVGEWSGGRKHGRGVLILPDGARYDGDWERNQFHGLGTYTYPDGSSYSGEWKQGEKHGQGVQRDKTGRIVKIGRWESGKYVGKH